MLKILFSGLCGLSVAAVCAAQPPLAASAPAEPRWLTLEAQAPLRARVYLLPMAFSQGRDTPVYTGYRPLLRFADQPEGSTCALNIPPGVGGELKPGETAEATLRCLEGLKLREDRLQFQMFQGGRLVGEGQVLP